MSRTKKSETRFPVQLTQAQRRVVAHVLPVLADRLQLGDRNQRTIRFTMAELNAIQQQVQAVRHALSGRQENSLRHVLDATTHVIEHYRGTGANPTLDPLYQFKITLLDTHPPIWRRIQVKDCTLDKLHEHIQTAMGWTNNHLHHFKIGQQLCGDPLLMQENSEEMEYKDSTTTRITDILPKSGKRTRFEYEYDFGDSWHHEVLFEGMLPPERGKRYPVCLEGARACPPEDVGGVWGYQDFLAAITDPDYAEREELLAWAGGELTVRSSGTAGLSNTAFACACSCATLSGPRMAFWRDNLSLRHG
jgi:hypothetical protein